MTNLKGWAWWRSRLVETASALVIAIGVIQLSGTVAERQKALLPAESWLTVNEVFVPNFAAGTDPEIIYDRTIHENFSAFWIAEVQHPNDNGLWTTVCTGNGVNEYDPSEVIPNNTVRLLWFTNGTCGKLRPGSYRIKTTYAMTRPGWPEKRLFVLSDTFRVVASEDELPVCPFCGRHLEAE